MSTSYTKEELEYLLPDYITDNISEYDKEQVEHGLRIFPDLLELYTEMKSVFSLADNIKYNEPGSEYWQSMILSINERIYPVKYSFKKKMLWKYMLPAAAAILLIIFYFILRPEKTQITETNDINTMTVDSVINKEDNDQPALITKQDEILNKNPALDNSNSEQKETKNNSFNSFLTDNSYDSNYISDAGNIEQQEIIDEIEDEFGESILEGSEIDYDEMSLEEENEILNKINNINL